MIPLRRMGTFFPFVWLMSDATIVLITPASYPTNIIEPVDITSETG